MYHTALPVAPDSFVCRIVAGVLMIMDNAHTQTHTTMLLSLGVEYLCVDAERCILQLCTIGRGIEPMV